MTDRPKAPQTPTAGAEASPAPSGPAPQPSRPPRPSQAAIRTVEDAVDAQVTLRSEGLRTGELPPDAGPEALLGLILPGQFRVLRALGEGGFGTVYLAEQLGVDRLAVIKVVRPELVASANLLARFDREAKVLASLGHHHLVQLYVADRLPNGQPFLAMEYGGDRTLQDELRRAGRLPPARALVIAEQVCDALEEAHSHDPKVVHRDLKPANVMLAEKGGRDWVKVVDVGMARLLGPGDSFDDSLVTARGALIGTPAYFSPEQARGEPADERSDLYALGCVLFEMLAGRLPFEARTPPEFIHAHCYDAPLPLEQAGVEVPDPVRRVIYRALEKEPSDRFQSAGEMREALKAARASLGLPSGPPTPLPEPMVTPPPPAQEGARAAEQARRRPAAAPPRSKRAERWALIVTVAVLAPLGVWQVVRTAAPDEVEQALAAARASSAAKDFKAALAAARRAGPSGAALAQRLAPEAEAQEVHETLAAALQAHDPDLALEVSKRCRALSGHFCEKVEGRQGEVRLLHARAHLAAAREQQAKGALEACRAEAALVLGADPADAAARALAEACGAPREVPAARPPPTAPGPKATLAAAAPAAGAPAPAGPDAKSVDAAAARLVEVAAAAAAAGELPRSIEHLLAAEALQPGPELRGRIYKDLIGAFTRTGEQARACRTIELYRPLAPAGEKPRLAQMAALCTAADADKGRPRAP